MHELLLEAMVKFETMPPGLLLSTPALQEAIDQLGDGATLGSPVWPTASDAITASAAYVAAGGTPSAKSSIERLLLVALIVVVLIVIIMLLVV